MRAVVFNSSQSPLELVELSRPTPIDDQILIRVHTCGVCRTDLHIRDGELSPGHLPLVLGHQIVGTAVDSGKRIGVSWLGWTCGECRYCKSGRENLCTNARFTGRDIDGGFAEYTVANRRFCFEIPDQYSDEEVAPLLCGGLIGYRALTLVGDAERLGLYGFGSGAHIVCQVARHQGRQVFAFTRKGDSEAQEFALKLGAVWAGDSTSSPPEKLDGAIIFAPAGELVPRALKETNPGGTVVCAGIHMSDIPSFPYNDLWQERTIRSVANLTRRDAAEFLNLAPTIPVQTTVTLYPLEEVEVALNAMRSGERTGSAVIRVSSEN